MNESGGLKLERTFYRILVCESADGGAARATRAAVPTPMEPTAPIEAACSFRLRIPHVVHTVPHTNSYPSAKP